MKFKVIVQAGSVYNHSNYDLEREILDPIGAELIEVKSDDKNDFIKEAKNADALIAGKMQLSKEIIESNFIIGSLDECKEKISNYIEAGVQHFTLYFLDYPSYKSLELLSDFKNGLSLSSPKLEDLNNNCFLGSQSIIFSPLGFSKIPSYKRFFNINILNTS